MSDASKSLHEDSRIADRMVIQDLLHRWCRAVDRLDRQGMQEVFHEDACERHGLLIGTATEVIDWIMVRHQGISFVSHSITNLIVEFAGPDLALAESVMRNIRRLPAGSREIPSDFDRNVTMDLFTSSRFIDIVERRNGIWRVAERTLVQDWRQYAPVADGGWPPESGEVGRRDLQDPIYQARRRLGLAG